MKAMKDHKYHIGMEFRLYPSYKQKYLIDVNIGACRFVYNRLVALNEEKYRLSKTAALCPADKARLDYVTSVLDSVSSLQNSAPFLSGNEVDSQCVANAKKDYNNAWQNYKNNPWTDMPTFHKKRYDGAYQTNPHYQPNGSCNVYFDGKYHLMLPKLGRCKVKGSPKLVDRLFKDINAIRFGTITIRRDAIGRYFVSVQLASDNTFRDPVPATGSMRGYDMNLKNFYTDSDGNVIDNPKYKKSLQKELSKAQHVMSRRMEQAKADGRKPTAGSNYQKARKKAAYLNIKIAARREDFQHVLSKKEIESQDFIFVEDLKTKNLMHNKKLSYVISDASWNSFHKMLEYKAGLYNRTFAKVPARLTTQTCSSCGEVLPKDRRLTLADREWACPSCGTFHDRDHNSAKVILFRGMASLGL